MPNGLIHEDARTIDKSKWANATFEKRPTRETKLKAAMRRTLMAGATLSVTGDPGCGKTSEAKANVAELLPHGRVVYMNGPNLSMEELTIDSPLRDRETNEITLSPAIAEQLRPVYLEDGSIQPYIIILDDPNQAANKGIQNTLMQIKHNLTLQQWNLRSFGCVGVVELNNGMLTDTNSLTTDLAAADRVVSIEIGAQDTNWKWALAEKYSDIDLAGVFRMWSSLPRDTRAALPPRVLDHVIDALLAGYPGIVGLPLDPNGHRRKLATMDGDKEVDRTAEIISQVAAVVGAPNPARVENIVAKAVRDAKRKGWTILIEGEPGGGKTELSIDTIAEEMGPEYDPRDFYFSLPTTDPERFTLPMPTDGVIKHLLTKPFAVNTPKVIVIDEANRGGVAIQAMLMELNQEGSIAGHPVPGMSGIVNLQNPQYVMGRKMSVSRRNRAQSERFTLNIQLTPEDIKSDEWLLQVFPTKWADQVEAYETMMRLDTFTPREKSIEDAHRLVEMVLDWYNHDLDDEGRQWITNRGKERLVRWLMVSGDPDDAIIHFAPGEKAPVITAGLRQRLAEKPMTNLEEIVTNPEEWIEKMKAGKAAVAEHGTVDIDLVQRVLEQAAISQLDKHFDVVVDLLFHLPRKHRQAHLASSPDRSDFWVKAMLEMQKRYGNKPQG